ncbi:MAG: cysteine peptidase family C39 domain-containing protein [bacterium]
MFSSQRIIYLNYRLVLFKNLIFLLFFLPLIAPFGYADSLPTDNTVEQLWTDGETTFNQQNYTAALAYYQAITSLNEAYQKRIPDNNAYPYADVASLKIMRCYEELKNHPQVEKAYSAFINAFPNSPIRPAVEYTLAHSLEFNQKNYREALKWYAQVTAKYPTSSSLSIPAAKLRIAEIYLDYIPSEKGYFDYWMALKLFQEVESKYPKTVYGAQALFAVAYTNHMLSRIPQAREAAQRLVDNYSAYKNQYEHGLYTLAFLDYREGKWDQALKEFQAFVDTYPNSNIAPEALKQMALIYYYQGNYLQAIAATEQIISNYPASPLAVEAKNQVQKLYQKTRVTLAKSPTNLPLIGKTTVDMKLVRLQNTNDIKNIAKLCGPNALKSICDYYNIPAEVNELAKYAGTSDQGTDLWGLYSAATIKGFTVKAIRITANQLQQIPFPAIAHIYNNHYIVLREVNHKYIVYSDSQIGFQQMPINEFNHVWNGVLLVLLPRSDIKRNTVLDTEVSYIRYLNSNISISELVFISKSEMLQIRGGNNPTVCVFFCPNGHGPINDSVTSGFQGGVGAGQKEEQNGSDTNSPVGGGNIASIGGGTGLSATSLGVGLGNKYTFTCFPEMEIASIPGGGKIVVKRIFVSPRYPDNFGDNNPYGNKWTINYNTHLIVPEEGQTEIAWSDEYGNQFRFIPIGNYYILDNATHHYGRYAKLIKQIATNEWVLEFKDGMKYFFPTSDASNYSTWLSKMVDRNGNTIIISRDSNCNIIKNVHDSLNRQITFLYDTYNHLTALVNPTGTRLVSYTYNGNNDLIQITDPDGYSIYYSYNNTHQITTIRDSFSGSTALYQYEYAYNSTVGYSICSKIIDAYGRITKFEDSWWGSTDVYLYDISTSILLRSCEYQFDSDFYRVTGIRYSDSAESSYVYDSFGNLIEIVTRNNNHIYNYYDSYSNLTAKTDEAGNTSYYWYNTTYNIVTCAVDPLGNRTYYSYDTCRNLLWIKDPLGNQNSFTYDGYGNRTSTTDALNRTIRYFYDQYSQLTTVIGPSNETSRFYNDTYGNRTCSIDPLGNRTYYGFDTMRRLASVKDATNETTQYEYYANGLLQRVTDAKNNQTSYTYDWRNRLVKETNAASNYYQYYYDRFDNITTRRDGNGQYTDYYYDSLSQLTTKIYRGGQTIQFLYDLLGNMTTMNDPNIGLVYWYYDLLNRVTTQSYPLGMIQQSYDDCGRKTSITDPDGNTTIYYYAAAGQVYMIQNGFNQFTQYRLNVVGLKTQEWYENSVFTDYTYDNSNRLTQIKTWKPTDDFNRPDNNDVSYRWNEKLRDWTIESCQLNILESDTSTVALDTIADTQGYGSTVDICFTSYSGDTKNAFIIFGYSSITDFYYAGAWVDTNKWAIGHYQNGTWTNLTTISKIFLTSLPYRIKFYFPTQEYEYYRLYSYSNTNGFVLNALVSSDGIPLTKVGLGVCANPGNTVHTHFDNYILNSQTNIIQQYDYIYDANGNRIRIVDSSHNTTNYLYDTLSRLTTEQRLGSNAYKYAYWYDSVGNRTTMVFNTTTTFYAYNTLNQLTARNFGMEYPYYNYTYDYNGNLQIQYYITNKGDEYPTFFSYDRENRLTGWECGDTTINYIYSALGKRLMEAYNNNTTVYFFDGMNTVLEKYKASNWANYSTSAVYTLAPGSIGHIISERKNNADLYYHYDPIGNVQFITDSYGNVTVSYVQEGFGNVLAANGSLASNFWHLTTKQLDPDTGFYYFSTRWYDPMAGRFITKSPVNAGFRYTYCENNPISRIDPNGE